MSVSEQQLSTWAQPPNDREETKCQETARRISKAIKERFGDSVSVFLQGSYKNRTNVKRDSDVDIVARHNNYFFPGLDELSEQDKRLYWAKHPSCSYTFTQFKGEIQSALESEFAYGEVKRKPKCIKVIKNDQRVDADVVPCFVHKRFRTVDAVSTEGIEFLTDSGGRIYGFPEQHYDNGVAKNDRTRRTYKGVVRILKNVRNELIDQKIIADKAMPSFFIECLVWNVPDNLIDKTTYSEATRNVIIRIWNDMGNADAANNYAEVSDLLWLFRGTARTHEQAKTFMEKTWTFLGYS